MRLGLMTAPSSSLREFSSPKELSWQAFERSLAFKVVIITMYLGTNISLNMLNKWTLSLYGFRFPLTMSIAHMAFSFLALGPFMTIEKFRALHVPTLQKQWIGLLAIATFFAFNIGFNNVSLMLIPLSLVMVIRACIPIVAAIGSMFIENKVPTVSEMFSLVVIFLGVALTVWEGSAEGKAPVVGSFLCFVGTVSNGLMMSSIGRLMSEKLDVLRLTFYTAPLTCLLLIPFFYSMESANLVEYQNTHSSGYIWLLFLGCVNALGYNMAHTLVIKITSAVTTTVIGEMKIILMLVLSAVFLGESDIWTVRMVIGCTTAVLGFCLYSHTKLQEQRAPSQPIIKGIPDLGPSLSDSSRGSKQAS